MLSVDWNKYDEHCFATGAVDKPTLTRTQTRTRTRTPTLALTLTLTLVLALTLTLALTLALTLTRREGCGASATRRLSRTTHYSLLTYYLLLTTSYVARLRARRPLSQVVEERNQLRLRDMHTYVYSGTCVVSVRTPARCIYAYAYVYVYAYMCT